MNNKQRRVNNKREEDDPSEILVFEAFFHEMFGKRAIRLMQTVAIHVLTRQCQQQTSAINITKSVIQLSVTPASDGNHLHFTF